MGKLIPRLIGLFPKLECGKHQVGSEDEVGISTKGEKDQNGRDVWRGTFSGLGLAQLYSLRDILIKFEVSPQPFEPVFTPICENWFNSF